jgi:hypothetical protein
MKVCANARAVSSANEDRNAPDKCPVLALVLPAEVANPCSKYGQSARLDPARGRVKDRAADGDRERIKSDLAERMIAAGFEAAKIRLLRGSEECI